jgi:hypothetical protein
MRYSNKIGRNFKKSGIPKKVKTATAQGCSIVEQL